MERYLTLDGQSLELTNLTSPERSYLDRCLTAYEQHVPWSAFSHLTESTANPLLAGTAGWVTQTVLARPLYQAVRDLEDRLGIEQGWLSPEAADDVASRPDANQRQPLVPAAHGASASQR